MYNKEKKKRRHLNVDGKSVSKRQMYTVQKNVAIWY
jgi:hypothetical protein